MVFQASVAVRYFLVFMVEQALNQGRYPAKPLLGDESFEPLAHEGAPGDIKTKHEQVLVDQPVQSLDFLALNSQGLGVVIE